MKFLKFFLIIITCIFFTQKSFSNIEIAARYAILQDSLSGKILYEKDADEKIYPASKTKIMTSIVAFDLLKKGETSLDELITISEKAWRLSQSVYSSMFIMLNDQKAEEIGMDGTNFSNSSGINDVDNYSTVRDILKMSRYMIQNYPEYYSYFKETTFTWDRTGGDPIKQGNRNPLLYKNIGADGIKTGYLAVEKYSLAASIKNGERRMISVASGFESKNSRSRESAKILNWGLKKFDTIQVAKKSETIAHLDVWLGKKNKLDVVPSEDIYITVPKRKKKIIKAILEYNGPLQTPIKKGDVVGSLYIYVSGELKNQIDILSNEDIKKLNIFSRLLKSLNYLVWGDV